MYESSCLQGDANKNGRTGAVAKKKEEPHPDQGLSGSHELIKFLGRGGTGDTYLFRDRATGEEVAIKLVKRPVPKVLQPNLLREIRVSSPATASNPGPLVLLCACQLESITCPND